jgi:hypothetical protein
LTVSWNLEEMIQYSLEWSNIHPIFIGINILVSKGLGIEYPCQVVNRFRCPFERSVNGKDSSFDVNDLFRLSKLAFSVEISLAKARKDDSEIRIKSKEELLHALTDVETLGKILEQGSEAHEVNEYIRKYLRENLTYIIDYFMRIRIWWTPKTWDSTEVFRNLAEAVPFILSSLNTYLLSWLQLEKVRCVWTKEQTPHNHIIDDYRLAS